MTTQQEYVVLLLEPNDGKSLSKYVTVRVQELDSTILFYEQMGYTVTQEEVYEQA